VSQPVTDNKPPSERWVEIEIRMRVRMEVAANAAGIPEPCGETRRLIRKILKLLPNHFINTFVPGLYRMQVLKIQTREVSFADSKK